MGLWQPLLEGNTLYLAPKNKSLGVEMSASDDGRLLDLGDVSIKQDVIRIVAQYLEEEVGVRRTPSRDAWATCDPQRHPTPPPLTLPNNSVLLVTPGVLDRPDRAT